MVKFQPKILYVHRIYIVLANRELRILHVPKEANQCCANQCKRPTHHRALESSRSLTFKLLRLKTIISTLSDPQSHLSVHLRCLSYFVDVVKLQALLFPLLCTGFPPQIVILHAGLYMQAYN